MSEAARQYSLLNASTTESYESELSMKVSCVTGDGVSYFAVWSMPSDLARGV